LGSPGAEQIRQGLHGAGWRREQGDNPFYKWGVKKKLFLLLFGGVKLLILRAVNSISVCE